MKKFLLSLAAVLLLSAGVFAQESGRRDVGIFYFVWLGQHPSQQTSIFDISKLLKEAP